MDLPLPSVSISHCVFDDLWGRNLCFGLHESRPAHLDALSLEVISWPLLRTVNFTHRCEKGSRGGKTQKKETRNGHFGGGQATSVKTRAVFIGS